MALLTANDVIRIWEAGYRQDPGERAITILSIAYATENPDTLRNLSLGRRNMLLLGIRERLFGVDLNAYAECPACRQSLEFTITSTQLFAAVVSDQDPAVEFDLETAGYSLRFRLLNTNDIHVARTAGVVESARRALVRRCIVEARRNGSNVNSDDLPESVITLLAEQVSARDVLAEIVTTLSCPGCKFQWQAALDIASFCYSEIAAMARRLLREVHMLARAYAWREADILGMTARRREYYLEMIDQ